MHARASTWRHAFGGHAHITRTRQLPFSEQSPKAVDPQPWTAPQYINERKGYTREVRRTSRGVVTMSWRRSEHVLSVQPVLAV